MKNFFIILILLFTVISCTSSDLYMINYSDDPGMQGKMERDYGKFPLWKD